MYDRVQLALTRAALASCLPSCWEERIVSWVLIRTLCTWLRLEALLRSK